MTISQREASAEASARIDCKYLGYMRPEPISFNRSEGQIAGKGLILSGHLAFCKREETGQLNPDKVGGLSSFGVSLTWYDGHLTDSGSGIYSLVERFRTGGTNHRPMPLIEGYLFGYDLMPPGYKNDEVFSFNVLTMGRDTIDMAKGLGVIKDSFDHSSTYIFASNRRVARDDNLPVLVTRRLTDEVIRHIYSSVDTNESTVAFKNDTPVLLYKDDQGEEEVYNYDPN